MTLIPDDQLDQERHLTTLRQNARKFSEESYFYIEQGLHTYGHRRSVRYATVARCDDVLLCLQATTQVACASERTLPERASRHCCSSLSSAARNPTLVSIMKCYPEFTSFANFVVVILI